MTTTKKTLLATALLAALGTSSAQAFQIDPVNVYLGDGTTLIASNTTALDWNEAGSGVAVGMGPFGDPTNLLAAQASGTPFDFLYQANLVSFTGAPTPSALRTIADGTVFSAGQYEFTAVASLSEKVATINNLGGGVFAATFKPVSGSFSIFFDSDTTGGAAANTAAGTGFDDGVEIARFDLVPNGPDNLSGFFAAPGTGAGSTKFDFKVGLAPTFVNPLYLENVPNLAIVNMLFNSNLNFPAGTSQTSNFHIGGAGAPYANYIAGPNDIIFKVDAASNFNPVPEPGSLALFGIGLIGAAWAGRRRKSVA